MLCSLDDRQKVAGCSFMRSDIEVSADLDDLRQRHLSPQRRALASHGFTKMSWHAGTSCGASRCGCGVSECRVVGWSNNANKLSE
jgi:hypothetical protein